MKVIPLLSLTWMLLPIVIVAVVYARWVGKRWEIPLATLRMVSQLLLVGFVLNAIFATESWQVGFAILTFMMVVSAIIALRSQPKRSPRLFMDLLISIVLGGSFNLVLVIFAVVQPDPLLKLEVVIPLAGMIYSNSMNVLSVGGERFHKQISEGSSYKEARKETFRVGLIPQVNMFLAVGLVSLPGMMTGQVLSGISPLIAVRYQITVMCMILGSSGLSLMIFLFLQKNNVDHSWAVTSEEN